MTRILRPLCTLSVLAAGLAVSACQGMIDENATLDPRALETPGIDSSREANYPRGSANPNPEL